MRISHSITALITSASHSMEQLSGGSCVKSEADSAANAIANQGTHARR
jgi:hypothetical protein